MKILDKLLNNIRFDKRYVFFSIIIVILGIITGSFFIVILNNTDKNLIIEYITSYFDNINTNLLQNTIINNYLVILVLSIVGYSCFLFPINILILFYKSFIIGFTISSFILTYNLKGIIYSFIYIFPHLIINILIFMLITAFTTRISLNMIKYIIKKENVNMRHYFNKYISIIIVSLVIIFITSIYEANIMPIILKKIVNIIN